MVYKQTHRPMEQNRRTRNKLLNIQVIFNKVSKNNQGRENSLFNNSAGEVDKYMKKYIIGTRSYTTHKNELKMG